MRILVDTNVLVRMMHVGHPQRKVAHAVADRLRDDQHELRTVPQVLYEYWAVATRLPEQNGLGFAAELVHDQLLEWQAIFPTLRDERGILGPWLTLARNNRVIGKQAHDARLAAAMQRHGLTHILTFNGADFARFSHVIVLDPHRVQLA